MERLNAVLYHEVQGGNQELVAVVGSGQELFQSLTTDRLGPAIHFEQNTHACKYTLILGAKKLITRARMRAHGCSSSRHALFPLFHVSVNSRAHIYSTTA